MPITRTFTREQLDALGLPDRIVVQDQAADYPNVAIELHREYVESRRWESINELIFRAPDDRKAYRVCYRAPLTENQDSDPWEDYGESVEAVEVEQYDRTVKAWRPVQEQRVDVVQEPCPRVLTPGEHDRAWHAIEGAAGAPGADPETILQAVLAALHIQPPSEEDWQAARTELHSRLDARHGTPRRGR
ncbi:hypothetical protein [Streptomyces longispororuber]|uniref:hypothetical protein n=1 Tax=Streptomyces longispororuber TaxID=68230 RepID=UPI0036F67ED3